MSTNPIPPGSESHHAHILLDALVVFVTACLLELILRKGDSGWLIALVVAIVHGLAHSFAHTLPHLLELWKHRPRPNARVWRTLPRVALALATVCAVLANHAIQHSTWSA